MKPASREINIFNVSTIDLFASALGAFVVVAFVLLPYFSKISDAPPESPGPPEAPVGVPVEVHDALRKVLAEAEAKQDDLRHQLALATRDRDGLGNRLASAEAERDDLREQLELKTADGDALNERLASAEVGRQAAIDRQEELEQALAEAESSIPILPSIDLVIALDTTNSMANEVASLREEIAGLTELLVKLAEDAAVGMIDFKDRCDPPTALRVAPIKKIDRASVGQLTAFARSMSPGASSCNQSGPEDFAEALRAAVGQRWRAESERRYIVMISDNPAHEDMIDQAVADAGRFAQRTGARHTVSTVFVDTSAAAPTHADIVYTVAFMRQVADAGRGRFVAADENASVSLTILQALFGD